MPGPEKVSSGTPTTGIVRPKNPQDSFKNHVPKKRGRRCVHDTAVVGFGGFFFLVRLQSFADSSLSSGNMTVRAPTPSSFCAR